MADFPRARLEMLHNYPLLLAAGRRMHQVGLEQWIAEPEVRAATGFAYIVVRFPEEMIE